MMDPLTTFQNFETGIQQLPTPDHPASPDGSFSFYMKEEEAMEVQAIATRIVGQGRSKQALSLTDGRVLMIQNPTSRGLVPSLWSRIVREETQWSKYLRDQGLLVVDSKKVEIRVQPTERAIPAYVCTSFASLAKRDLYVLDGINHTSSTWNCDGIEEMTYEERDSSQAQRAFFARKEDHYDPDCWFPLFTSFIDDFQRMNQLSFFPHPDCLNFAVIAHTTDKIPLAIRPFLFDFSMLFTPLSQPAKRQIKPLDANELQEKMTWLLRRFFIVIGQSPIFEEVDKKALAHQLAERCWTEYCRRFSNTVL